MLADGERPARSTARRTLGGRLRRRRAGVARAATCTLAASTTIGNYILPALLARFKDTTPTARLQLKIGNTLDVVTAVRDFATDLGFIEGPCRRAGALALLPWLDGRAGGGRRTPAHPRRARRRGASA